MIDADLFLPRRLIQQLVGFAQRRGDIGAAVGDFAAGYFFEQHILLVLQAEGLLAADVGRNHRGAVAIVQAVDQQTRRLLSLFETGAVAGPGHAEGIVQYDDQRHRAAAGEQTGAGLKDRIGEQEGETNHRQSAQRQQQPVAQAVAP